MEECHKLLNEQVDDPISQFDIRRPLPLGGQPGQVTIQAKFFFNKDLVYLRLGDTYRDYALSISKMKATQYLDAGLEQMVPDNFWAEEECDYDIAASLGISHWWFKRKQFYIDRHTAPRNKHMVISRKQILSVVKVETHPMYGYDYLTKIVLSRKDNKEYTISEGDFKYLHPYDFEDLFLLNLQGKLHHLTPKHRHILVRAVSMWIRSLVIRQRVEDFQLGIESYQSQVNLTRPKWNAANFHDLPDYSMIEDPMAVVFKDKYGVSMLMRFDEVHKFSDGTLQLIEEALDFRIKEYKIFKTRPGRYTADWTVKDFELSNKMMHAIRRRLKTRRIFRHLEAFVGGRELQGDYRLLQRTS